MSTYPRIATFKNVEAFRGHAAALGLTLDCDEQIEKAPASPLAQPLHADGFRIGNRFVIHPMEGWDAEEDGQPSELVRRRWRNFGRSGAKWIWGGEAMAVVPEARANPHQLVINAHTRDGLAGLLDELHETHRQSFGSSDDLLVGFQLTHSGRFSRPRNNGPEPKILYHHPLLDRKFCIPEDYPVLSDDDVARIIDCFVEAAGIAEACGAGFVDIKHCHGYLGHEFLSAHSRKGRYGGSFENRTRFLREVVAGIRAKTSLLKIGVRLSAFDFVPFHPDPGQSEGTRLGPGIPDDFSGCLPYEYGFGAARENPVSYDLSETENLIALLEKLDVRMLNVSCGSPYYNPHIQRPALFPPSDGYQPPEDPLVGCDRQIEVTAALKKRFPNMIFVGSAYSYLQEYLPHVAQWVIRTGRADAVGLGRMVLACPTLPKDVLERGVLDGKRLCRTFSDCTTGPRNGLLSGCFPLDPFYRKLPEAEQIKKIKADFR